MGHYQHVVGFVLDLVILGLDNHVGHEPVEQWPHPIFRPARQLVGVFLFECLLGVGGENHAPIGIRLVVQLGIGIEIDPLVGIDDDRSRIDPLLVIVLVGWIGELVQQAIGAKSLPTRLPRMHCRGPAAI